MKQLTASNINRSGFEDLIDSGVKKLKNFGFIKVNEENILSDEVYCFFFHRFLDVLKGKNNELDKQIEELLNIIKGNK